MVNGMGHVIIKQFKPINKYTFFIFKLLPFFIKKYHFLFKNIHLINEFPFIGINVIDNMDYFCKHQQKEIRKEILPIIIKSWLNRNNLRNDLDFYYLVNENPSLLSSLNLLNLQHIIYYPLYYNLNYHDVYTAIIHKKITIVVNLFENIIDEFIPRLFLFKNYFNIPLIIKSDKNIITTQKVIESFDNTTINTDNMNQFIVEFEYYNNNYKWYKLFKIKNKEIIIENLN